MRRLGFSEGFESVAAVLGKPFYWLFSSFKDLETIVLGSKVSTSFRRYALKASSMLTVAMIIAGSLVGYLFYLRLLNPFIAAALAVLVSIAVILPLSLAIYMFVPMFIYSNRGSTLESKFPLLMFALSLLLASGMNITQVFGELERRVRGELRYFDFEVETINALVRTGVPLDEALRRVSKLTPSPIFRELLVGLASVARVGGDPTSIVKVISSQYFDKYAMRIEKTVNSLAVLMETYMAFALMLPTLLGSAAILFMIMPMKGLSFETIMFLSIFVLVPVVSLVIVVMVDTMVSKLRV